MERILSTVAMIQLVIIRFFVKESQLSRERMVADARLAAITAQLARFPINIVNHNNHHFHPHIDCDDCDDRQVAERSEEKRCKAEAKAEKP